MDGKCIIIMGPTGAGKSALGLFLAKRLGGEIISADAIQVYKGLDIGTAKPSPPELMEVRHYLVDILEPDQRFSAGEFTRLALGSRPGMRFCEKGWRSYVIKKACPIFGGY